LIRQNKTLPLATNDKDLHVWLMTFDGMEMKSVNGKNVYFLRGFEDAVVGTASKRKNTSPLVPSHRQKPKRPIIFKPLLFDEDITPQSKKQETPRQRQIPFIATPQQKTSSNITNQGQASRPPNANRNISKVTSTAIRGQKIQEDAPKKSVRNFLKILLKVFSSILSFQGLPRLYGAVLLGDDNFLNIAAFNLNFEVTYKETPRSRIRSCGYCVSGLTISKAIVLIENMDDSVQHLLINVGSVDIAEGRELIEMVHDLQNLLTACDFVGIDPILTTLPPLPNHMLGNRKETLIGFNEVLRHQVSQDYAIIDLNKVMVKPDDTTNLVVYQPIPRKLSGSKQALVLWNNLGRNRIITMIIKNLGHALYFNNFIGNFY
jgi:hypothetical protein